MKRWLLDAGRRLLGNDWALSTLLGAFSFVILVLFEPHLFEAMLLMSVPFFVYAFRADWKACAGWIVVTIPFQYYFDLGGLTLTLTELYMFLFCGMYFLSRAVPARSLLLPSQLAVPCLFGLTPLLPALTGHLSVVKESVRILAAVFFCLRLSRNASTPAISGAC